MDLEKYTINSNEDISERNIELSEDEKAYEVAKKAVEDIKAAYNNAKAKKAEVVKLPYLHNQSRLTYDEKKGVYVYSEYGQKYEDAAKEDKPALEFKNVIIQGCTFFEYGDGYMCYNAIGSSQKGYYLTNGKAIPISWEKPTYDVLTKFYKLDTKEEITLNTGKTYITLCPDDVWSDLVIE